MGFPKGIGKVTSTGATITITNPNGPTTNLEVAAAATAITSLTGDVTASGPGAAAASVVKIQGVAITAGAATLAAGLANATTRTATAAVLAGEETVFTGSTAAQTLTFPVTPQVSTINTVLNLSSVTVTVAAGAGNTLNSFGTVGSVVLPVNGYAQFVFVGTVWYCIDSNAYANLTGAPVPANGYGITGNTGATPTPAVGLTQNAGVLGSGVPLPQNVATKIIDTASLGIGTWLVTIGSTIQSTSPGAAADTITLVAAVDTATATLTGPTTGVYTPGVITTAWNTNITVTFVAVVTVAGTIKLTGTFTGVSGAAAISGAYTGYTAVRIA